MILIGLASSLPFCGAPPQEVVRLAIGAVGAFCRVIKTSRLYDSPAWPDPSDPPFVNAAIEVRTALAPAELLAALHQVEASFGRRRGLKNAPRTLDLDLLAYERIVSAGDHRVPALPHPGVASRDFVLAPLCDIAPDWVNPANGLSARQMFQNLGKNTTSPIEENAR